MELPEGLNTAQDATVFVMSDLVSSDDTMLTGDVVVALGFVMMLWFVIKLWLKVMMWLVVGAGLGAVLWFMGVI